MWQQMTADQMREWLTLHCHLPLTLSICLSTSHSGMFSEVLARVVLCLECPVILLNYSSFESHLQAPLCETRARLPLRFHAPLFSLVTACPGLAPQNPSRIQKLFDLPGMSSSLSRTHFWASGACWSPLASGAGFHKPRQAPRPERSARL